MAYRKAELSHFCTMAEVAEKADIRSLTISDLEHELVKLGQPKFRGRQIYQWLWQKGANNFEEMTNLSVALRAQLTESYEIRGIHQDLIQHSWDGTIKVRYRLHDGHMIESVLIPVPQEKRYTVCVSSQVGCSLSCKFCATGQMKRMRNLTPGEIYDQVYRVNQTCNAQYGANLTNIVYMGMGEPLLNYANVMKSIDLISSPDGLGMSAKRITLSTAGVAKMIRKLADDNSKVNLALSLHAADDQKRNEIMPINEQNDLESLVDAIKYYYQITKNKISYEYITFKGYNDSHEDARNLIKLCKHYPVLVNIIEYNPIDGVDYEKSEPITIDQFASVLRNNGIMVTVRKSRGKDIDAACGQLANKE